MSFCAYCLDSLQERHFKNIAGGPLQSVADALQPMLNALSQVGAVRLQLERQQPVRAAELAAGASWRLC